MLARWQCIHWQCIAHGFFVPRVVCNSWVPIKGGTAIDIVTPPTKWMGMVPSGQSRLGCPRRYQSPYLVESVAQASRLGLGDGP